MTRRFTRASRNLGLLKKRTQDLGVSRSPELYILSSRPRFPGVDAPEAGRPLANPLTIWVANGRRYAALWRTPAGTASSPGRAVVSATQHHPTPRGPLGGPAGFQTQSLPRHRGDPSGQGRTADVARSTLTFLSPRQPYAQRDRRYAARASRIFPTCPSIRKWPAFSIQTGRAASRVSIQCSACAGGATMSHLP